MTHNASVKKDSADARKIEQAVMAIARSTLDAGKERAVFNVMDLFRSLKLSRMGRRDFPEAVCDVPTGSRFYRELGNWMIGEYGDDLYVAVYLGAKGSDWTGHCHNVDINALPKVAPAKPKPLQVMLPDGVDAEEALRKINELVIEMPVAEQPPAEPVPPQTTKPSSRRRRSVSVTVSIPAAPKGPIN